MDPRAWKALFALPLALCVGDAGQGPSVHRPVSIAPARNWPSQPDLPEGEHPAHDETNQSPMFLGLGAYTNASTASVRVDSGASGSYVTPAVWLPNHLPLVLSTRDFPTEPFRPPTAPAGFVLLRPDPKGHVPNPPVRRFTGSRSGRG
jgi:hypothetical protein